MVGVVGLVVWRLFCKMVGVVGLVEAALPDC